MTIKWRSEKDSEQNLLPNAENIRACIAYIHA